MAPELRSLPGPSEENEDQSAPPATDAPPKPSIVDEQEQVEEVPVKAADETADGTDRESDGDSSTSDDTSSDKDSEDDDDDDDDKKSGVDPSQGSDGPEGHSGKRMVKKRVGNSNLWELVPNDEGDSKPDKQSRKRKRKPQSESSEEDGEQEDGKLDNQSRKRKRKSQSESSEEEGEEEEEEEEKGEGEEEEEEEEVEEHEPENQSLKRKRMPDPASLSSDDEQNSKRKKKSSKPEPIVNSTITEVESEEESQEVKKPSKQPAEAKDQDVSSIKQLREPDLPLVVQERPSDSPKKKVVVRTMDTLQPVKLTSEGVKMKLFPLDRQLDPLEFEFKVSEEVVSLYNIYITLPADSFHFR